MDIVNLTKQTDTFLVEKGWCREQCTSCGKAWYKKVNARNDSTLCERGSCSGNDRFLHLPRQKQSFRSFESIYKEMAKYFLASGYQTLHGVALDSSVSTDLVGAGVQIFEQAIHRDELLPYGKVFVGQPSVRTRKNRLGSKVDGYSTSFINVCTERQHISHSEHLETFDLWLSMFSQLGFHMNDIKIVFRGKQSDWGTGTFSSSELFIIYAGLELGDASFAEIPTKAGSSIRISDIGFGLERIAWALNKTPRYFDLIKPPTSSVPEEISDTYRTLALLALEGIEPSSRGSGFQFRRLAKLVTRPEYRSALDIEVSYYLQYWYEFSRSVIEHQEAKRNIEIEVDRTINLQIQKSLGVPPPGNESLNDYFERLVYTFGVNPADIRHIINESTSL